MANYPADHYILSADWGTTHLRVRLVARADASVVAIEKRATGCKALGQGTAAGPARDAAYREALLAAVQALGASVAADLTALPVVISGMASSSLGWRELAYATVPFALDGSSLVTAQVAADGLGPILLISGVATDRDVMRGEETELIGLLAHPEMKRYQRDSVVIMPGTHCKHVDVVGGNIETFQTAMSGELYEILAAHSVLRGSVAGAGNDFGEEQRHGFRDGVHIGFEAPLPQALFNVRTYSLLKGWSPDRCAGFLSGILIAHELMAFDPQTLADVPVIIFADAVMAERYSLAFENLFTHGLHTGEIPTPLVAPPESLADSVVRGHLIALATHGERP